MRDQFGDASRKFGRSFRRLVARLVEMDIAPERVASDFPEVAGVPAELATLVVAAVARRRRGVTVDAGEAVELDEMRKRLEELRRTL
jgi:hypothetical protein